MGNATIRDVARTAAVSVASVSRALSGHAAVLPATRERIIAAARTLDYIPHAGARSLSMARAHAIGVVLPDLHGEFFSEVVRGMDREAHRLGFQLLLSNMHADPAQAALALRTMRGRVDGLIIMAPDLAAELLSASLPRGLPSVLMNTAGFGGHPAFEIANHDAAATVVRHLRDLGHRRIVHIAGPPRNKDAIERRAGFLAAMASTGAGDDATVIEGDFTEAAGTRAAARIAADAHAFDAVFAGNDIMAIGCMLGLRAAGIAVPGQIAVAGFDDIPAARYITPGLTTVRVDIAELGARAVARLAATIAGEDRNAATEALVPELVVRESTGPVASNTKTRTKNGRGKP